ncbi:DUF6415 family natural product biosynthesis protein [Streptomyces sp. NPDC050732]|uniref:DUF6415 family natural product biosynthesis protein n=1 Tax=Streptomyces sp. NPDC050732 TaxID=3154632 RepID=UPI0034469250
MGTPRAVARWAPPLDADTLADVLAKVQGWHPLPIADFFADLDLALESPEPPPAPELSALIDRLRAHLKQLSGIAAVADPHFPPSDELKSLIERSASLYEEETPQNYQAALGLARRMGSTVHDLLDEQKIATLRDVE